MRIYSLLPSATEVIASRGLSIELLAAILNPSDHDHIHKSMACRLGPLPIHQRP